jgi:hypothetical protein
MKAAVNLHMEGQEEDVEEEFPRFMNRQQLFLFVDQSFPEEQRFISARTGRAWGGVGGVVSLDDHRKRQKLIQRRTDLQAQIASKPNKRNLTAQLEVLEFELEQLQDHVDDDSQGTGDQQYLIDYEFFLQSMWPLLKAEHPPSKTRGKISASAVFTESK